jgi:phosphoenolpyruvate carboxykinase (ATP)
MIPRVRPASRITPDSRFDTPQGRPEADQRSKKIGIADSSAIVKGIVEGTIGWEQDPDFGYLVATSVPGVDDPELLRPRDLYSRQGRRDEYRSLVERLRSERREFLATFPGLDPEVLGAI